MVRILEQCASGFIRLVSLPSSYMLPSKNMQRSSDIVRRGASTSENDSHLRVRIPGNLISERLDRGKNIRMGFTSVTPAPITEEDITYWRTLTIGFSDFNNLSSPERKFLELFDLSMKEEENFGGRFANLKLQLGHQWVHAKICLRLLFLLYKGNFNNGNYTAWSSRSSLRRGNREERRVV
ncbi:hypothetical protein EI94DRAFT_1708683 [Lactarius quietus]|nr:hypothetical protein EI94DRAFT_1708683 [Lactarius quietus]